MLEKTIDNIMKDKTLFLFADHTFKYKSKRKISRQHDTFNWPFCNHDHTKCCPISHLDPWTRDVCESHVNGMKCWSFPSHVQASAYLCVLNREWNNPISHVIYFMLLEKKHAILTIPKQYSTFSHCPPKMTAILIIYRTNNFSPFP